jgi:hypothetical protein
MAGSGLEMESASRCGRSIACHLVVRSASLLPLNVSVMTISALQMEMSLLTKNPRMPRCDMTILSGSHRSNSQVAQGSQRNLETFSMGSKSSTMGTLWKRPDDNPAQILFGLL